MKLVFKIFLLVSMAVIIIGCSDDTTSTSNAGGQVIPKPNIDNEIDDVLNQIGGRPTDMVNWQKSEDIKVSNTATGEEVDNYFLPKKGVAGSYKKAKVVITNGTVYNHGVQHVITNEVTNKEAIEGTFTIIKEPFTLQDFSVTNGFIDATDKQGYDQVYIFTPTTMKNFESVSIGGTGAWEDIDQSNPTILNYIVKWTDDNKTSFIQVNKEEFTGKYLLSESGFDDDIKNADNYTKQEEIPEQ